MYSCLVQKSAILAFGVSWEAFNARKWWKHVWMQNHLFQETMPPFRHVCIGGGGGAMKNIEYILSHCAIIRYKLTVIWHVKAI